MPFKISHRSKATKAKASSKTVPLVTRDKTPETKAKATLSAGVDSDSIISNLANVPQTTFQRASTISQDDKSQDKDQDDSDSDVYNPLLEKTSNTIRHKTDDNCDVFSGSIDSISPTHLRSERTKLCTKNFIFAVLASTVGASFQHGYNGGLINAPEALVAQFINETHLSRHNSPASDAKIDLILATIVSVFCVGGFIGALLTAPISARFGRKEGLLINNALVLVASPLMFGSRAMRSYELLILGRLLIGINAGLGAGLAPLYLADIAPQEFRGLIGASYQLLLTIANFFANFLGLPVALGTVDAWPLLFAVPLAPAAFTLLTLPRCVESPRYLLMVRNKQLEAQRALAWVRNTVDIQDEMESLINEHERAKASPNVSSCLHLFTQKKLRHALSVAVVVMLSQQLSGINAVLYFSTSIFKAAGLDSEGATHACLALSGFNVLATLISVTAVERVGRRRLQLVGLAGMAIAAATLAICVGNNNPSFERTLAHNDSYSFDDNILQLPSSTQRHVSILVMFVFVLMFASGPGSIPWLMVAELFPLRARSLATSIAVSINWLANFIVLISFLPLTNILHGHVFFVFAGLLSIFYIFTYYKLPETKNVSPEEIETLFDTDDPPEQISACEDINAQEVTNFDRLSNIVTHQLDN